jgi:putative endonuclease
VYYCYILCCADYSFYVGVTEDLEQRVQRHNEGTASDWTSRRRPVSLVWSEEHPTLSSARSRENQLKRWSHHKKASLVGGSPRLRSGQTRAEARAKTLMCLLKKNLIQIEEG